MISRYHVEIPLYPNSDLDEIALHIQDFGGSGASRRGSNVGHPRGPQAIPAAQTLLHQHHHQHHDSHPFQERGVIEFSKDESESDNAALSDQNSDGILPITQIVAQHHIKQVGSDNH